MLKHLFLLILLIPVTAYSDHLAALPNDHVADAKSDYKLLILGDSLSAAYNLKQEQGWVSLLQNAWADKPITIVDAAISGETTSGGLARLPRLLEQHAPTHLLIELGANDGLRGYPVKTMQANLIEMVEMAQAHQVKIALQEMLIPPNFGRRYTKMFTNTYHDVAKSHKVVVIPFFMQDVALNPKLMLADGLHPNADAQPIIAEFMDTQLGKWLFE